MHPHHTTARRRAELAFSQLTRPPLIVERKKIRGPDLPPERRGRPEFVLIAAAIGIAAFFAFFMAGRNPK